MRASVAMKHSIVAMSGAIMPLPFRDPADPHRRVADRSPCGSRPWGTYRSS